MSSVTSLNEIFDRSAPASTPSVDVSPKSEGSDNTKEAQGATPAEPAVKSDDDGDQIPEDLSGLKKALTAERKIKREHAKELKRLQAEFDQIKNQLSAKPQEPKKEEPKADPLDFLADPEKFIEQRIAALKSATPDARLEVKKFWADRSEKQARQKYSDYQEKLDAFVEFAKGNKEQWDAVLDADDPGEYVYNLGANVIEAKDIGGDLKSWKEKERERIKAEILGEKSEPTKQAAKPPPKSIATARGSGVGATGTFAGPTPLTSIFAKQRRA